MIRDRIYTIAISEGDDATGTHEESHGTPQEIQKIYSAKWPGFTLITKPKNTALAFKTGEDSTDDSKAIGRCWLQS